MKQLGCFAATVILSIPCLSLAAPARQATTPAKMTQEGMLMLELTGKDFSRESDASLYAQLVSAYEKTDEVGFKARLQSFTSRFPRSPLAGNVYFLAGRFAVDQNNYAEAIRNFSEVEKKYPRSSKVIPAKFAKAMTYKKMNLPEISRSLLLQVVKKYPGSPESFRAQAEMRTLK